MFFKTLIISATLPWLASSVGELEAPGKNIDAPLEQQALATLCLGPMTLQIAPKDRGALLLAFGQGGCSQEKDKSLLGLRLGSIVRAETAKPASGF